MPKRSKGAAARAKGKAYELHVASLFKKIGWSEAARRLEFQAYMAEKKRDLENTQPFAVQCKNTTGTPSITAIEKVLLGDGYSIRVAMLKRLQKNGKPGLHVAVVDAPVFLEMLRLLKEHDLLSELTPTDDI